MLPWSNETLTGVINKRRPVKTPVMDRHFNNPQQVATETVQIDVIEGPEGLMVAISRDAESKKSERETVSTQTITIPRFSEHNFVTAGDQLRYRAPGVQNGGEAYEQLVVRRLDSLRKKGDRTKEFMCIKALQGEVVDGNANVIAQYPVPASVNVTLDGGSPDNPVDIFDDATIAISRALGQEPGSIVAYCGKDAYKALRNTDDLKKLLTGPNGERYISTGTVPPINGIQPIRLVATFVNNQGVETPFLGDDQIILASEEAAFQMYHGPCSGKGGRLILKPWIALQSEVDDPPTTKVRGETNPLPVVNRPEAIRRYTVVPA